MKNHQQFGIPTFPIQDAMVLGIRSQPEYEWLLQHGDFQSDICVFIRITKKGKDYVAESVTDDKTKFIAKAASLSKLCLSIKVDIAYFYWYSVSKPIPATSREKEALDILKQALEFEPKWVTHPMSLWNRARRLITLVETGEVLSDAKSYDAKADEWRI